MIGLLMTRPPEATDRFVAALPPAVRARLNLVVSPLLEIVTTATAIDHGDARGLIFTSVNGVAAAATLTGRRDLPCHCVGDVTAAAARAAGWAAQAVGENAEAMIAALIADPPPAPLLHLRGAHGSGDVTGRLTRAGIETRVQTIYDQRLLPLTAQAMALLDGPDPVIAPIFSPRTARQFANMARGGAPLYLVALSPAVAEPLETLAFRALDVAAHPDAVAMAALVAALALRVNRVEGGTAPQ
jgi:uroporphyrinogen-III synthase